MPWLDIPTQLLLTAGERDTPTDDRRPIRSDATTRPLPHDTAARAAMRAGRPLRRRNNGLG